MSRPDAARRELVFEMEQPGNERRKFPRMSAEIAARLRFGDREVAFPMVRTCDISAEGLGLVLRDGHDGAFAVLDTWQGDVEIELDLPDGKWLKLPAKIAWRRTDQDDGGAEQLRVGLEFGEIGAADRKALGIYIQ